MVCGGLSRRTEEKFVQKEEGEGNRGEKWGEGNFVLGVIIHVIFVLKFQVSRRFKGPLVFLYYSFIVAWEKIMNDPCKSEVGSHLYSGTETHMKFPRVFLWTLARLIDLEYKVDL